MDQRLPERSVERPALVYNALARGHRFAARPEGL